MPLIARTASRRLPSRHGPFLAVSPVPGLVTEVFVSKFGDHLPLYRLEDILTRYGVYISRSTMCDWVKAVRPNFSGRCTTCNGNWFFNRP